MRKIFFIGILLILLEVQAAPVIKIDGSSTVYPITEAVSEEFQNAKQGKVRVTVGISGTGGGFKKFCRGEIDISGASRPVKAEEKKLCAGHNIQYIEFPIAYDAISIVVHKENPLVGITVAELKKIWEPSAQGKMTRWNQINPKWPDAPLKLYGPGADSGTFDYFTEAVVGKAQSSRGDFTASEDDNVLVQGIATDRNALGYFGFAYYLANRSRLKALGVDGGRGPVLPSQATVKNGTYSPLSRPVFIYVSTKSLQKPEVKEFVQFYLDQCPVLVPQVHYVPYPKQHYASARKKIQ